ncbi:MAG: dUTP diphosphatase [Holosporaceae bacterium]|jgi:dUTP pyrophosphatase|nr:dUTP diphosphatase [Holosporaceae bacterium]
MSNAANMHVSLKILENASEFELPSYATAGSAGVDLRAAIFEDIILKKNERKLIPTGIVIAIPQGYNAEIRPRSGLAYKNGITVLNSPGTIDSDYRGEIGVLLINLGDINFIIKRGMRIAQLIVQKCETIIWNVVDSLEETHRAEGGYGSTGIK